MELGVNVATRSLGHSKKKYPSICSATPPKVDHWVKKKTMPIIFLTMIGTIVDKCLSLLRENWGITQVEYHFII